MFSFNYEDMHTIKKSNGVNMKKTSNHIIILLFVLTFFSITLAQEPKVSDAAKVVNNPVQLEKNDGKNQNILDDIIVPWTKIATLFSVIVGIFISFNQYRLKVKEEINLSKKTQAEIDVKLLTLFSETIEIANGRKGHIVSEKTIEKLFDKNILELNDFANLNNLETVNNKLNIATRVIPIGLASQISAITALGVLGSKYDILHESATNGLMNLIQQGIKNPTEKILANMVAAKKD